MARKKLYSSQEIAQLVNRWQGCRFATHDTDKTIINISYHDLYRHGSETRCSPVMLEKMRTALTQAYNEGIRAVTMYAPQKARVELSDLAISITTDPEWKVYPYEEMTYLKNATEITEKIWTKELFYAEMDAHMHMMAKAYCDDMGLTDDALDELRQYMDIKNFNELPPHLRHFFSDKQEEPLVPENKENPEPKP